jgi:uncharacterized CHY-type Zn-finger protein
MRAVWRLSPNHRTAIWREIDRSFEAEVCGLPVWRYLRILCLFVHAESDWSVVQHVACHHFAACYRADNKINSAMNFPLSENLTNGSRWNRAAWIIAGHELNSSLKLQKRNWHCSYE